MAAAVCRGLQQQMEIDAAAELAAGYGEDAFAGDDEDGEDNKRPREEEGGEPRPKARRTARVTQGGAGGLKKMVTKQGAWQKWIWTRRRS